jgi:hypothetical protein
VPQWGEPCVEQQLRHAGRMRGGERTFFCAAVAASKSYDRVVVTSENMRLALMECTSPRAAARCSVCVPTPSMMERTSVMSM